MPINTDAAKHFKGQGTKVHILAAVGANPPTRIRKQSAEFNVISVGRFVPIKGFDLSIMAFLDFYDRIADNESNPNINLILVGKGPEEFRLRKLTVGRRGKENVKFISWVSLEEMQDIYQESSLFLFPSHEGAGMVTVEALAYGLPVVCLDNSGPGEIVSNRCAIKVPVRDYQATCLGLANALEKLFYNMELYNSLSAGAIDHFNALYAWSAKRKFLLELYERALYHGYETESKRNIVYTSTQ